MFKNILLIIFLAGSLISFSACTKNVDSNSDTEVAEADLDEEGFDEDEVADLDEEAEDVEEGIDEEDSDEIAEQPAVDEEDEELSEEGDEEIADTDEGLDSSEDELSEDDGFEEEVASNDSDDSEINEPLDEGGMEMEEEAPKKTWIPVKKIAETPFNKNGALVNAVYIARPGDDINSISSKIYGVSDRGEDLYQINPNLRKYIKTGDKVYYNSPTRPGDDSKLLTFYEDLGLQPEVYVTQQGDNIRKVSEQLLGDPASWKEVWATNQDVESKWAVEEGIRLRYWASTDNMNPVAQAPEPKMDEPPAPAPPAPAPPAPPVAKNDPPAPPAPPAPPKTNVAGTTNNLPPPPPAPPKAGNLPPPPPAPPLPNSLASAKKLKAPPAPKFKKRVKKKVKAAKKDNADQTMALGAAAILLLAGVALIVVLRKKKAAKKTLDDFANTQTQTQIE